MTEDPLHQHDSVLATQLAILARDVGQGLPSEADTWRVYVRCPDGAPSAAFNLRGYEQVLLFERRIEGFGFEMLMLDERFRQCDFTQRGGEIGAIPR